MTGFVLLLIVMTVAALAAIAWPFLSNRKSEPSDSDLEVYRAQLEELQRDREAGLIGAEDAEAARVEVSRRLLGVARRGKAASPQPGASGALLARRAALAFALLLVPLTSAAMYLRLGSPDLRSGTEATRTANSSPETQTIEQMIAQVEAHLQKNPNDGRGWEVLGPVYAKVGRYDDSVRAWSAAIDRLGEKDSGKRWWLPPTVSSPRMQNRFSIAHCGWMMARSQRDITVASRRSRTV